MNDIDRWFERTARDDAPPNTLYTCLVTGRIFAYFGYRLRYSLLMATAQFVVHVAEFFILLSTLGGVATFTVMVLRAGSLIVGGGWWGLLEVMRERLRGFAASGDPNSSAREIGRWLFLAVVIAIAVTVTAAVTLILWRGAGDDPVARLYSFLVVLELAVGLPVRVLHSGVYATRRVYKPIWSMFAPTLIQILVLGVGFFFYPTAAIVTAIVASNALGIWITVHYSLEVYRLMGLRPEFRSAEHGLRDRLPRIPLKLGLETTLSGLSMHLDAALVLALVGFYGTDTRTFELTAGLSAWQHVDAFRFFYLIMPLFRGTYGSASIFYFDLVRLRSTPVLRALQLLFFRKLLWVAPAVGLFFWSLAAALGLLVLHDIPATFLLALIPLFVLRSVIGLYQIRLFAEDRFGTHIATLVLLIVMLWLVWMNPNPAADLIQITAAMMTQLIVLINAQHLIDRRPTELQTLLPIRDWIHALSADPNRTSAGVMTIPDSVTTKQRSAIVALMQSRFAGNGHFAFPSPTNVLYYERISDDRNGTGMASALALQTMSGATANRAEAGSSAVSRLLAHPGTGPATLREMVTQFHSLFPDGIVFHAPTLQGAKQMRDLDPALLARAIPTAVASLESGAVTISVSDRWLTPVFRRGVLRLLFVLPADPDPQRIKDWRSIIRSWNLDARTLDYGRLGANA